jgi:hypothetical protein
VSMMPADVVEVGQKDTPRQDPKPTQLPRRGKTDPKTTG